jgi:HAD superfamily hydrolase (TIGR01509 family)
MKFGAQGPVPDPRAVIFDWGGVLMRTDDYAPRQAWDRRLGLPWGGVESVVHGIDEWRQAQCGLISLERYWQAVGDALHIPPADVEQLQRDFFSGDHLDGALIALIRRLRQESLRIGLLSNLTLELRDQLAELNILHLFDGSTISAEIGVMKPDPRAYRAILDQLEVRPDRALFIDDSEDNIAGGRECGMVSIRFYPGIDLAAAVQDWQAQGL